MTETFIARDARVVYRAIKSQQVYFAYIDPRGEGSDAQTGLAWPHPGRPPQTGDSARPSYIKFRTSESENFKNHDTAYNRNASKASYDLLNNQQP